MAAPAAAAAAGVSTTATAAVLPNQIILDANCPLSSQNNIVVPPQLLAAMPGLLRCTFTLPLNSSLTSGTVQAQLRTLFSATYEVDSGPPTPYDFAANETAVDDASTCVEVWAQRITDASQVQAADMDDNPDLVAAMSSLNQPGVQLSLAPKHMVSGRVPPSRGSLLAIPYRVCGNKSIEWTETYGPFASDSCGMLLVSCGRCSSRAWHACSIHLWWCFSLLSVLCYDTWPRCAPGLHHSASLVDYVG